MNIMPGNTWFRVQDPSPQKKVDFFMTSWDHHKKGQRKSQTACRLEINKGYHQLSPGAFCQSASVLRCTTAGTPPGESVRTTLYSWALSCGHQNCGTGPGAGEPLSLCNFFRSLRHDMMKEHKEKTSKRRGTGINSHSPRGRAEPGASSPSGFSNPEQLGATFSGRMRILLKWAFPQLIAI